MKNTYTKTRVLIAAFALALSVGVPAGAQQYVQYTSSSQYSSQQSSGQYVGQCNQFTYDMSYGGRGGDVARMQNYLINLGYLQNGSATGYFGNMTYAAVRRFQSAYGISPTGFFGASTRSALYQAVCNGGQNPNNSNNPTGYAPVITSLSPSYGPFGTVVTIYGRNFSQSANNSINFAGVNNIAVNKVSYDGTSLQFTVPASPCPQTNTICTMVALAPGQYPISVTNQYGTSNSVTFSVTEYGNGGNNGNNNSYQAPVIHGVEGSTTLTSGQAGAWSVRASDPSNQYGNGSLSYSVVWGDEGSQAYNSSVSSSGSSFVQNATFNHTYYNPGTYTVTFTVRNNRGLEARSTITVLVTGQSNNNSPVIQSISPSSGQFGTQVTLYGRNFTSDNAINFAGVNRAYTGIASYDGTTLRFTPTATPCTTGNYCAQVALNPGTYTVSVTNAYGTSNLVNYTVIGNGGGNGTSTNEQTAELSIGQKLAFGDIEIVPDAIVDDSRCPSDVTCIQAGRVVVRTMISGRYSYTYANIASMDANPYVTNDGYKIKIISVTPAKVSGQTIAQNQYRITYRIYR